MSEFSGLLDIQLVDEDGWPQLLCRLDPANLDAAAAILAEGIALRRIGVTERLHKQWQSRRLDLVDEPLAAGDLQILEAGLLQNFGTPDNRARPTTFTD